MTAHRASGPGVGIASQTKDGKLTCRGLVMEAASSSVGGRNEAVSMATVRVEEETKQPDVGGSEWQAEVAG